MTRNRKYVFYGLIFVLALAAPFLAPDYQTQLAFLWLMILFALTWDIMGGQMGYNSFGNVVFFGIGMYTTAVTQRNLYFEVEQYVSVSGLVDAVTPSQYVTGMFLGMGAGAILAVFIAFILGIGILGLRGHYFAICTLGLTIAAGETAGGIDYIGGGSGMVAPVFPLALGEKGIFFYYVLMTLAVMTFVVFQRLYSSQFGLAINAIRDDEDKAEAMGLHTTRYKAVAWCASAFFLGAAGGATGNLVGFIDPLDVAFAGSTFGVWMVLMAILGGKGTMWGPVIGAAVFHITQELFWTYLFGWQRVALGALIVIIVVFFPKGIMGFLHHHWPQLFGQTVDEASSSEREGKA
ncbi:MAG: branched-chain amino acid ABC transporter permease [Rhodospirillaceae bacterium]|nr:branched-chain amino acid ABC transporter permease [Rhodospirillaceae bacterium]